jgi:hypothetical protein
VDPLRSTGLLSGWHQDPAGKAASGSPDRHEPARLTGHQARNIRVQKAKTTVGSPDRRL